jgi:hypothetical protein
MDVNGLNKLQNTDYLSKVVDTASAAAAKTNTAKTDASSAEGVIYDKSSSTTTGTDYKTNNAALIQKLKQDSEDRINQLKDIVSQMMTKQGTTIGKADDIWSFLASGDFTIDEAAKKKAQEEISEDGYWGVKQTSDRILDFAKALSGNDSSKADLLLDAFKKGFEEATKTWGKDLPDISKQTYDAVVEKFDKWKNGEDTTADAEQKAAQTADADLK